LIGRPTHGRGCGEHARRHPNSRLPVSLCGVPSAANGFLSTARALSRALCPCHSRARYRTQAPRHQKRGEWDFLLSQAGQILRNYELDRSHAVHRPSESSEPSSDQSALPHAAPGRPSAAARYCRPP
jgi:hypothetical protein